MTKLKLLFFSIISILTIWVSTKYSGNIAVYLGFSIIINGYLALAFSQKKIFFDSFMSTFLWLGFWLKTAIRIGFFNSVYEEHIGNFTGSGSQYDNAFIVVSIAILPLIILSIFRRKKFTLDSLEHDSKFNLKGLETFYYKNRKVILLLGVTFLMLVTGTNAYFRIYQKGVVPPSNLPFVVYGIFATLMLFGSSVLFSIFLNFDLKRNSNPLLTTIMFLWEGFCTNSSMLSRGMILNTSAGLFGVLNYLHYFKKKFDFKFLFIGTFAFGTLFIVSVQAVNFLREADFQDKEMEISIESTITNNNKIKVLLIDRWVGAEGLFAVSSSEKKNWDIFKKAWSEKMRDGSLSVYDSTFIHSVYKGRNSNKHHFISIPGIVAFLFYPGSYLFLFFGMTIVGLIGWLFEFLFFKYSGQNFVLTSLISQVIAYRFAHFGYVPSQSYQLFGSLLMTLLAIVVADRFLKSKYYKIP